MNHVSEKARKLIKDTYKIAKANDIEIRLVKDKFVFEDWDKAKLFGSGGYFDSDNRILAVAIEKRESRWLSIFVHESCHMDQFLSNSRAWEKYSPGHTLFFNWLQDNKSVKKEQLEQAAQDAIRIELDCERRSLEKIKKYNLDLDEIDYIRGINAYLHGYLFSLETKKWLPDLYVNKNVLNNCSTRLKKSYTKIPRRLHRAFVRELKAIS